MNRITIFTSHIRTWLPLRQRRFTQIQDGDRQEKARYYNGQSDKAWIWAIGLCGCLTHHQIESTVAWLGSFQVWYKALGLLWDLGFAAPREPRECFQAALK
jgi:hypothetical protein